MSALAPSHAALMDGVYRYQRHIYDLTRKYYLLGRDRMIRDLDVPAGGAVLELGCGTGRNLALIARAYPAARLCGLDISAGMLETAAASIRRAGLAGRVTLARGDASSFRALDHFGRDGFDRVVISYSLSMIPPWRRTIVWRPAARSTLSISAPRKGCPPGSAPRCAPGSPVSTSPRVIPCARCWNRNASASAQVSALKRFIAATRCAPSSRSPDPRRRADGALRRRLPCFCHLSAANPRASKFDAGARNQPIVNHDG